MATRLTKPVTRETAVTIKDGAGPSRPLIVTLSGNLLILRLKGRKSEEVVDIEAAYFSAIKARTWRAMMEKAKARAAKRRAK